MSKLYRIKPLEWEENPTVNLPWSKESTAAGYRVYQAGIDFDAKKEMIVARNPWGWTISDEYFDSIEAAKAACESHRLKMLEAELEPAHQPEELPSTKATRLLLEGYNKMMSRPDKLRLKCSCCFHQWDAEAMEPCGECTNQNVIIINDQPSTELPTEPGLYWWRRSESNQWTPIMIEGRVAMFDGCRYPLAMWDCYMNGIGQWVRIPEPEAER